MKIKMIEPIELEDLVCMFLTVFNGPPWNDEWERSKAEQYLSSFIANPSFLGFSAHQDERLIGACFGEKRYWWEGDEYFINEIFIDKSVQKRGFGSKFIYEIQKELLQKGIRAITLLTDRDSLSDKFYIKNGFQNKDILTFKFKNF